MRPDNGELHFNHGGVYVAPLNTKMPRRRRRYRNWLAPLSWFERLVYKWRMRNWEPVGLLSEDGFGFQCEDIPAWDGSMTHRICDTTVTFDLNMPVDYDVMADIFGKPVEQLKLDPRFQQGDRHRFSLLESGEYVHAKPHVDRWAQMLKMQRFINAHYARLPHAFEWIPPTFDRYREKL